jgi:hypothetical protein
MNDVLLREAELNHRLTLDQPGRQFEPVTGSRWGELILPAPGERPNGAGGLRVVMFASFEFGYAAVEGVKAYAKRFPGRVELAGLATDDPINSEARIGLKKRVWKYMEHDEVLAIETAVVEAGLSAGAPVFTGEIKTEGFRALLDAWKPDVILSCVFGQVIDHSIIDRPAYGIYNFHPTDLEHGFGAGPTPAQDMAAKGLTTTVWTIHHVIEALDAGGVVAVSPKINCADLAGTLPADPLMVYDKLVEPVGPLAAGLVDTVWRRYEARRPGKLERIDLDAALPAGVRSRMQEPIRAERHVALLPAFDSSQLEQFSGPTIR